MAKELENPVLVEEEELDLEDSLSERFMDWVRTDLIWYAGSFTFHLLLMSTLLLFTVSSTVVTVTDEATSIEAQEKKPETKPETDPVPKDKMDLGEPPLDPTELTTETLTMDKPAVPEVKEEYNDESEHFEHRGGGSLTATSGDPRWAAAAGSTSRLGDRGRKSAVCRAASRARGSAAAGWAAAAAAIARPKSAPAAEPSKGKPPWRWP